MQSGVYANEEDTKPTGAWGRDRFMPTNFAFLDNGGFLLADGYGSFYIHEYDADHAFANASGGNYNEAAAKDSWQLTTAFLAKHLKGWKDQKDSKDEKDRGQPSPGGGSPLGPLSPFGPGREGGWSGREDLNLRPHGPEPCALPS